MSYRTAAEGLDSPPGATHPPRMKIRSTLLIGLLPALAATPAAACDIEPVRVHFATGSTALDDDGRSGLDFYAELLPQYGGDRVIRLTAHTDTAGRPETNFRLARRRAERVRAYLVGKGVPERRIQIENFGEVRARVALGDGRAAAAHRFVQVDILSAAEARRGSASRLGISPCRG